MPVVNVNVAARKRYGKGFVEVLPLLAIAVAASIELRGILVVLGVDV